MKKGKEEKNGRERKPRKEKIGDKNIEKTQREYEKK